MASPGEVSGVVGITELISARDMMRVRYGDFWLPEMFLPGLDAVHARFEPRPSDVFLASFHKAGTI
uniref:Sulfotransferase n=1 Tax=Oryza punctata TaxID=4537 RepID=A0A0E0MFP0_ORYPU